jgi:hypothetical protein
VNGFRLVMLISMQFSMQRLLTALVLVAAASAFGLSAQACEKHVKGHSGAELTPPSQSR